MVTTNGVAHNNYYNMVQKEINMDELFVWKPKGIITAGYMQELNRRMKEDAVDETH